MALLRLIFLTFKCSQMLAGFYCPLEKHIWCLQLTEVPPQNKKTILKGQNLWICLWKGWKALQKIKVALRCPLQPDSRNERFLFGNQRHIWDDRCNLEYDSSDCSIFSSLSHWNNDSLTQTGGLLTLTGLKRVVVCYNIKADDGNSWTESVYLCV